MDSYLYARCHQDYLANAMTHHCSNKSCTCPRYQKTSICWCGHDDKKHNKPFGGCNYNCCNRFSAKCKCGNEHK